MDQLPFLFSTQPRWVVARHGSFWAAWYLSQVYLYAFTPSPLLPALGVGARLGLTALESLVFLLPQLLLAYTLLYGVIPRLIIPAQYGRATGWVLLLLLLTGALSAGLSLTVLAAVRAHYLTRYFGPATVAANPLPLSLQFFLALMGGLRGSITIGGLAAALKLMKYYYVQQQQAARAELTALKAQLHPHFLFNTLNNIYAHAQPTAPVAAELVLGLAGLLRYMLYSAQAPLVELAEEVGMLRAYLELEQTRYGNQLEMVVHTPADCQQLRIAPLLLLPFVENCFKHGTSTVLEHPWLSLDLRLVGTTLQLKVVNGTAGGHPVGASGGLGLATVRRRLALLYPGRHQLVTRAEEELYLVTLTLALDPPAALGLPAAAPRP
ncbi:sensor histidine kinase [Hymenobacter crusticola]|uniref:sensor histidine kinase n=1 Tax=Hymenobacter crusticola TaxID=1770526 RepID=UPI001C4FC765|nr:histidine kinase [Hymenobacter crusticola]